MEDESKRYSVGADVEAKSWKMNGFPDGCE